MERPILSMEYTVEQLREELHGYTLQPWMIQAISERLTEAATNAADRELEDILGEFALGEWNETN